MIQIFRTLNNYFALLSLTPEEGAWFEYISLND